MRHKEPEKTSDTSRYGISAFHKAGRMDHLVTNLGMLLKFAGLSVLVVPLVILFFSILEADFAAAATPDNPTYLPSPVGSPTVPVTSRRSGLHKSRSESHIVERNLAITGNVSGGKHFRDKVPYNSTSEFGAPVGSSTLNPFIRRSTGSTTGYIGSGRLDPYFLPSRTVSSMKRDGASGLSPPKIPFAGGTGQFALPPMHKLPPLGTNDQKSRYPNQISKPFDMSASEIERLIKRHSDKTSAEDLPSMESKVFLESDVAKTEIRDTDVNVLDESQDKTNEDMILQPQDISRPDKVQALEEQAAEIEELEKNILTPEDKQPEETENRLEFLTNRRKSDRSEKNDIDSRYENQKQQKNTAGSVEKQIEMLKTANPDMSEKTVQRILEKYRNFESVADAKYYSYITVADQKLKEGKYYAARDIYELAKVWKKDNGQAMTGKGYAAFAAGEYMTSVNNFIWAIEKSGENPIKKVNLYDLITDAGILEKRIAEIKKLNEKDGYYKAVFLLAYISYQNNDPALAAECINATAARMGHTKAWKALKKAIDDIHGNTGGGLDLDK